MKLLFKLVVILIFVQCATTKMDEQVHFKIIKTTTTSWKEDLHQKGTTILIYTKNVENITFEKMYYNRKISDITIKKDGNTSILEGNFKQESNIHDYVLHSDPKQEYGNKVPKQEHFPFNLKPDEVIIGYKKDGKSLFYKIKM